MWLQLLLESATGGFVSGFLASRRSNASRISMGAYFCHKAIPCSTQNVKFSSWWCLVWKCEKSSFSLYMKYPVSPMKCFIYCLDSKVFSRSIMKVRHVSCPADISAANNLIVFINPVSTGDTFVKNARFLQMSLSEKIFVQSNSV